MKAKNKVVKQEVLLKLTLDQIRTRVTNMSNGELLTLVSLLVNDHNAILK